MRRVLLVLAGMALFAGGCANDPVQSAEGLTPSPVVTAEAENTPVPTEEVTEPTGQPEPSEEPEEPAALNLTREEVLEQTLSYARQMSEGDFSVAELFSETLQEQLSERDLKSAWKTTVKGLGEIVDFKTGELVFTGTVTEQEDRIEHFDGYLIVTADILYEEKGVNLTVTYNPKLQIEGLYLTYVPLAVTEDETELYTEKAVSIGAEDAPLDGLLTLPNGVEQPPVVLLVQGSGQSDLNETIGAAGNAPFEDLAHGLAEQGIAVLRYNKRYYQYLESAAEDMTIYDEVLDDVNAAIALLAQTQEVDGSRIYVLGHSLGGMLAPWIAKENPAVAGIISLAGSPRSLWEILLDQNMEVLDAMELTETEREELQALIETEYERVQALAAAVREAAVSGEAISEEYDLSDVIFGVPGYYWASLAEIDPVLAAVESSLPMLFLQGSEDFQVSPEKDYQEWQTLLSECDNAQFEMFGGLNHLFMESDGTRTAEEYDREGHVAEEVIRRISDWILEQ